MIIIVFLKSIPPPSPPFPSIVRWYVFWMHIIMPDSCWWSANRFPHDLRRNANSSLCFPLVICDSDSPIAALSCGKSKAKEMSITFIKNSPHEFRTIPTIRLGSCTFPVTAKSKMSSEGLVSAVSAAVCLLDDDSAVSWIDASRVYGFGFGRSCVELAGPPVRGTLAMS